MTNTTAISVEKYLHPACREGKTMEEELDNIKIELDYLIKKIESVYLDARATAISKELPIRLENLKKYDTSRGLPKN